MNAQHREGYKSDDSFIDAQIELRIKQLYIKHR